MLFIGTFQVAIIFLLIFSLKDFLNLTTLQAGYFGAILAFGSTMVDIKILAEKTPLADRKNMVYQGTIVVFGSCRAIVVDTGMKTELGKISGLVQEVKAEKNPFKEKVVF